MAIRPGVPAPSLAARMGEEAVRERGGVEYRELTARSLLNRCDSPRMPFTWTVNPYRGCAMGCRYCYAAYTHEFMGIEGADFHSLIYVKTGGEEETARRLAAVVRTGETIALGTATDPYQPGGGGSEGDAPLPGAGGAPPQRAPRHRHQGRADPARPRAAAEDPPALAAQRPRLAHLPARGAGAQARPLGPAARRAHRGDAAAGRGRASRPASASRPCCPASPTTRRAWTSCSGAWPRPACGACSPTCCSSARPRARSSCAGWGRSSRATSRPTSGRTRRACTSRGRTARPSTRWSAA